MRSLLFNILAFHTLVQVEAATMDITMVPGQNNDIEVRVRTDQDFTEVFSSIVFTVRWSNTSGANLGALIQTPEQQDAMNVNASGPEQVEGDQRYQIYAGFGFSLLSDLGLAFAANQEFVLCRIPVLNAVDVFSIVNDTFTAGNNGDFYVSLNGANSTGVIYDTSTGVEQGPAFAGQFSVWPNPAGERITVTLGLGEGVGPVELELLSTTGQVMMRSRMALVAGAGSQVIDLRFLEPAVYLLRANSVNGARTVPVIKR
jgi:hypothetical protein